ncbi:MAG: hypothetical protein AAB569_04460 [Patescibacteria group bacterium]
MNLLPILFKYTRLPYAKEMLRDGIVFINTLNHFRNENKYGLERGDKGEGTQKTYMRGKTIDLTNQKTIPPTISRAILEGKLKGTGKLIIQTDINEFIQDCYVYSLSTSNNLSKKFQDIAGYDTLVEITNPIAFAEVLTRCINQQLDSSIKTYSFKKVEYINSRNQEFEQQTQTHPIFVKENRHNWQEEFRLVWGVEKEINEVKIVCPKIKNLIRLI